MKIIPINVVSRAYAPATAANYSASRGINSKPKDVWLGIAATGKFFGVTSGAASAMGLVNTNGSDIDIHLYDDTGGTDLAVNGNFETAGAGGADVFANWTENAGDGSIADEIVDVHGGSHALKMTAGPSADTEAALEITGFTPGSRIKISAWTHGDGAHAGRWRLEAYDGASWSDLVATVSTGEMGTTYVQAHLTADIPAGTTKLMATLYCPADNGGIACFDDVTVFESAEHHDLDLSGIDTIAELIAGEADHRPCNGWVDYTTPLYGPHTIEVVFNSTDNGDDAELGILWAGKSFSLPNPDYDLIETPIHNSLVRAEYMGGTYIKNYGRTRNGITQPDNVYQYSGQFLLKRNEEALVFRQKITDRIGPLSCLWQVDSTTNLKDYTIVFGGVHMESPTRQFSLPGRDYIKFKVTGVR